MPIKLRNRTGAAAAALSLAFSAGCGFNLLPVSIENEIGRRYSAGVLSAYKPIRDTKVSGYIDSVFKKLLRSSDRDGITWTITVIKSSERSAVVFPGGNIFLSTGIIKTLGSEDELAGLLAHEAAHTILEHHGKMISGSILVSFLLNAAVPGGNIGGILAELGALKFSRDHEIEADKKAVAIMSASGYNPAGYVKLLKMLSEYENFDVPGIGRFLSTHPPADERIAALKEELKKTGPADRKKSSAAKFRYFKKRISKIT